MSGWRCDVCQRPAPGALPCPELRVTLCSPCDADLVVWLADGGTPQAWPVLEAARRAAVARAGVAARDRLRERRATRPGPPVPAHLREQAARGIAIHKARGGWTA